MATPWTAVAETIKRVEELNSIVTRQESVLEKLIDRLSALEGRLKALEAAPRKPDHDE